MFMENDVEKLPQIKIRDAAAELSTKAPTIYKLLTAIGTSPRPARIIDEEATKEQLEKCVALSTAILLKTRSKFASAFQFQIGLLMKHYGLDTRGINTLAAINISVHNNSLVEIRKKLEYARTIKGWKEDVEVQMAMRRLLKFYLDDQDGIVDPNQFPEILQDKLGVSQNLASIVVKKLEEACATNNDVLGAIRDLASASLPLYGLVGDNFDLTGKVDGEYHQRHWFNCMAIKERPVDQTLSREFMVVRLSTVPLAKFLPTICDLRQLGPSFLALWERTLVKWVPAFTPMEDKVDWHLKHKYEQYAVLESDFVSSNFICSSALRKSIFCFRIMWA